LPKADGRRFENPTAAETGGVLVPLTNSFERRTCWLPDSAREAHNLSKCAMEFYDSSWVIPRELVETIDVLCKQHVELPSALKMNKGPMATIRLCFPDRRGKSITPGAPPDFCITQVCVQGC